MPRQHGACEHAYLAGNCPFCVIQRLRLELEEARLDAADLEVRLGEVRELHKAAVAERDEARAEAHRQKQYRVALERHLDRDARRKEHAR